MGFIPVFILYFLASTARANYDMYSSVNCEEAIRRALAVGTLATEVKVPAPDRGCDEGFHACIEYGLSFCVSENLTRTERMFDICPKEWPREPFGLKWNETLKAQIKDFGLIFVSVERPVILNVTTLLVDNLLLHRALMESDDNDMSLLKGAKEDNSFDIREYPTAGPVQVAADASTPIDLFDSAIGDIFIEGYDCKEMYLLFAVTTMDAVTGSLSHVHFRGPKEKIMIVDERYCSHPGATVKLAYGDTAFTQLTEITVVGDELLMDDIATLLEKIDVQVGSDNIKGGFHLEVYVGDILVASACHTDDLEANTANSLGNIISSSTLNPHKGCFLPEDEKMTIILIYGNKIEKIKMNMKLKDLTTQDPVPKVVGVLHIGGSCAFVHVCSDNKLQTSKICTRIKNCTNVVTDVQPMGKINGLVFRYPNHVIVRAQARCASGTCAFPSGACPSYSQCRAALNELGGKCMHEDTPQDIPEACKASAWQTSVPSSLGEQPLDNIKHAMENNKFRKLMKLLKDSNDVDGLIRNAETVGRTNIAPSDAKVTEACKMWTLRKKLDERMHEAMAIDMFPKGNTGGLMEELKRERSKEMNADFKERRSNKCLYGDGRGHIRQDEGRSDRYGSSSGHMSSLYSSAYYSSSLYGMYSSTYDHNRPGGRKNHMSSSLSGPRPSSSEYYRLLGCNYGYSYDYYGNPCSATSPSYTSSGMHGMYGIKSGMTECDMTCEGYEVGDRPTIDDDLARGPCSDRRKDQFTQRSCPQTARDPFVYYYYDDQGALFVTFVDFCGKQLYKEVVIQMQCDDCTVGVYDKK